MIHSFDTEHAKVYGMPSAVIIANFQWWINRNKANGENCREGRTWTYNSVKALGLIFDYLSADQIRRAIDRLVDAEVLLKDFFSDRASDRTAWYAFKDESIWLSPQIHLAKTTNGLGKSAKSTNRTDSKPVGKPVKDIGAVALPSYSPLNALLEIGVDPQIASDWLQVRKGKKAAATKTAIDGVLREIAKAGMEPDAALRICCERGWAGFNREWLANVQQPQRQQTTFQKQQDARQALLDRIQGNTNANRQIIDLN